MSERADEEGFSPPTIKTQGTVTIPTTYTQWVWRCEMCGWLGLGHTNEHGALKEASDHYWTDHQVALCGPIDDEDQYGHPGHRFKGQPGVDAEKCERCATWCGK